MLHIRTSQGRHCGICLSAFNKSAFSACLSATLVFCDNSGNTAYNTAVEKHGKDEVLKVIQQCIPTNTSLPILHHVVKDAPQHFNDFCIRYSSAGYLRDENGRTITQTAIASASKTLSNDAMFFVKMTDDEIAEVDPVTKLSILGCSKRRDK